MDYAYLNQGGFDPSMSCAMSVGMDGTSAALAAAAAAAAVTGGQVHAGGQSGPSIPGSGYGGAGDPRCGPSMVPSPPAVGVHGYGATSAYGAAMRAAGSMHPGHHQYMAATGGGGGSGAMATGSCSMIPRPREHAQAPPGMFVSGECKRRFLLQVIIQFTCRNQFL
jgi:hypothetical protein